MLERRFSCLAKRACGFFFAVLSTLVPHPTCATQLVPMEVAQPVGHDNGVVKSHVTFMVWRNTFEPGLEINYICLPYQIPIEGAEPRNRNLADLAGIRTSVVRSGERDREGLFGDTLRVMLDLEEARKPEGVATLDEIIATVRECIFEMAALSGARRPYPKVLDIKVRGPEKFASLGGTSQIEAAVRKQATDGGP